MKKRLLSLTVAIALIFTGVAGRCAYVSLANSYKVAESYNSYTLRLSRLYTNIYDCKGELLNNNKTSKIAIIRPNEKCISELKLLFDDDETKEIITELSKGYPIALPVTKTAKTSAIKIISVTEENDENMLCRHLLDRDCGGLEQYVSEEIGSLSVNFSVDALGRILSGDEGTIINNNYDSEDGIIISIDKSIQTIAESAAEQIQKGSVVVMDAETSQVLASVSKGDDYLNHSISSYAVGSVFKLVVCAAAIECKVNPLYKCNSQITVGDTTFHCQNEKSHGLQTMQDALANSCNCYFVNLALKLGADALYETAQKLGFCKAYELYSGWSISAGAFPSIDTLQSDGQLALIGFGQGALTDSPIHFAAAVSCLVNGGIYNPPTLEITSSSDNRVISEDTSEKLLKYMRYVVTNGTASNAEYKGKTAGKTATAQSGIYKNGREVLNTWFAGCYPYSHPKYTIVVMCEDGVSGATDCCPVFRTIVEKIDAM